MEAEKSSFQTCTFYLRSITAVIGLTIVAAIAIVIGFIPAFLGYQGYVSTISYATYHKLFKLVTGLDLEMDEESKKLYDSINQPVIYICNHQSTFDIPFYHSLLKADTRSITKKENKFLPILGQYMWLVGVMFIDRKNRNNSIGLINQVADRIQKEKISIWMFPEGTRSHLTKPDMLPFKKGAFHMAVQAKVPIVPIVFENYSHLVDEKKRIIKPGKVMCKVMDPIETSDIGSDHDAIEKLSNECRKKMLDALTELSTFKEKTD